MEEQSLRLAASETLNKIVKATYLTHITRIQMTAFNEMKKVIKVFLTLTLLICYQSSHTHVYVYYVCIHIRILCVKYAIYFTMHMCVVYT